MEPGNSLKKIINPRILKLVLLAIFFSGCLVLGAQINKLSRIKLVTPEKGIGLPRRISIKSINLETVVEEVGLASDGSMGVPESPDNTAWYKLGPRPGESGSAVINGHVNREDGGRASFSDLHKLRLGDEILVQDGVGRNVSFVVVMHRFYDPKADAPEVFGSNDGRSHLNLITCDGSWNNVSKSYSKRLVIFADIVP